MGEKLVSVIIPIFNSDIYLEECLNSVINQTYKKIEIIAINDGSTDNSIDILKKYSKQYKYIKIVNQENSGQSIARNKGIDLAKGDYIYFLDSDDYIIPETLEVLINTMNSNTVDLLRFSADIVLDGIDDKVKKTKYKFDDIFNSHTIYNKEEFLKLTKKAYSASPVLYFMKRQLLIDKGIRFKPGIVHEDDLFTLEVFINTDKAMYLPEAFYRRRIRQNSTMTTKSVEGRQKSFTSRCIILDDLFILLKQYTEINELNLIRSRIKKLIIMLSRNYSDLSDRFKNNQIKKLSQPSVKMKYYYYSMKYRLISFLKKRKN